MTQLTCLCHFVVFNIILSCDLNPYIIQTRILTGVYCDLQKSPNYPDFKHKDTGEALWVEGRYNPNWVKSQLAILDSRMESFHDQNASMHLSDTLPY